MRRAVASCLTTLALMGPALAAAAELSGRADFETRFYPAGAKFPAQHEDALSPSLALQPELRWDLTPEQRLTFIPFARLDAHDDERTHFDIRELNWLYTRGNWDLRAGIAKAFWGVAESRHLVDIVNQTDLIESFDEEDKLGQPMLNANVITAFGTFSGFILPHFRERTFPGPKGRPSLPVPVDTDRAVYESGAEERHVDVALRWQERFNIFDIGLAHFSGTGREPRLVAALASGGPVLVPHYDLIDQTSLDAQATIESWLLKLEAIVRSGQGRTFFASVTGFEYTLYQVLGSDADLGLIAEYHFDGRDARAPATLFDSDLMVGARIVLNDENDTTLLAGAIFDLNTASSVLTLEAATRLRDGLRLELEALLFPYVRGGDFLSNLVRDHSVTLRLVTFF